MPRHPAPVLSTLLALVIPGVVGCGDAVVDPATLADTWVARSVNGAPLPQRVPATIGEFLYDADTLRLAADGRFTHVFTSTWVVSDADQRPRSWAFEGQFTLRGSRITLRYDCPDPPTVSGMCAPRRQGSFSSADRIVLQGWGREVEYRVADGGE